MRTQTFGREAKPMRVELGRDDTLLQRFGRAARRQIRAHKTVADAASQSEGDLTHREIEGFDGGRREGVLINGLRDELE